MSDAKDGRMLKINAKICKACAYRACLSANEGWMMCDYILRTGSARIKTCPRGMCSKFEPRRRDTIDAAVAYILGGRL